MFRFGKTSLENLEQVHPELVRVAERAIQRSRIDFGISEGLRSYDQQVELLKQKKTTTLESLHLMQEDGFAHAIDIFPYVNGKANYSERYFRPIIQTFITEAAVLEVQLEFGALWMDFSDWPHIELNPRFYP